MTTTLQCCQNLQFLELNNLKFQYFYFKFPGYLKVFLTYCIHKNSTCGVAKFLQKNKYIKLRQNTFFSLICNHTKVFAENLKCNITKIYTCTKYYVLNFLHFCCAKYFCDIENTSIQRDLHSLKTLQQFNTRFRRVKILVY